MLQNGRTMDKEDEVAKVREGALAAEENVRGLSPLLDEVQRFFLADRYATETLEPEVIEASCGHAVVRMRLSSTHRNAMGRVMGGALFTLADFALAIAVNVGQPPTTSVSSTIEYLANVHGDELTASCDVDHGGRRACYATCDVFDETGRHVVRVMSTCFRTS